MPARKTARKAKVQEFQSFLIDVVDWEVKYGFSLDTGKHSVTGGPYWEHVDLALTGTFALPEKLVGKTVSVSLLGDRRDDSVLDAPDQSHREPLGVGGLTVRGERREYLGSIPLGLVGARGGPTCG